MRLRAIVWLASIAGIHAATLNTQISVSCGSLTQTATSGQISCEDEDALALLDATFTNGMNILAEVASIPNDPTIFSASGSINATFQVTFLGDSGPGFVQVMLCDQHDPTEGTASASMVTSNGSVTANPGVCTEPPPFIPIVFGTPLSVQINLQAQAAARQGHQGSANASFSGFTVFDAQMQPVPLVAVVDIPEPATLLLLSVGAGLLGAFRGRFRGWPASR